MSCGAFSDTNVRVTAITASWHVNSDALLSTTNALAVAALYIARSV